jgi:hypothetical protein
MKITIFRYNGICISSVCVSILRCTSLQVWCAQKTTQRCILYNIIMNITFLTRILQILFMHYAVSDLSLLRPIVLLSPKILLNYLDLHPFDIECTCWYYFRMTSCALIKISTILLYIYTLIFRLWRFPGCWMVN